MKQLSLLILILGSFQSQLFAQSFYDLNSVKEIRLYFSPSNWDHILDSFYVEGQEERLLANVTIDGVAFDSVGIRYKGFSSVSVNRAKNPFNIKLDYVKKQDYDGVDKIKLSNVIQDPSFVREALSYEICRKYMPASKANYANVYINDTLWGLYTNVESVDDRFLGNYYGTTGNSFFKCNPANLDLFGENSNLGTSPGTDSNNYMPYYSIKSDYGWSNLYHLIDVLNHQPDSVEQVLNVDRTLWMHALNYSLINFDSYVGYAQNYYLYEDEHGRFNPIMWDLNMSFASYRLADASIHFSGFSIQEAKEMDPLLHHNNVSVYPRPLMRNLFANHRYRKMYIAHMRTIMDENFNNQDYMNRAQAMYNLIDASVQADTNKFYSYTNFLDNLTMTVSDLVDYPGISDLMDARAVYLNTYPGFQGEPTISNINTSTPTIAFGGNLSITAQVVDADTVILAYRYGENDLFTKVLMLDDGTQNDGAAGDGVYGYELTGVGNEIQYYFYADNDSAGVFSPQRAAYEFYTIKGQINPGDLVINELMPTNYFTVQDEDNDYDDWIELYNNSPYEISTEGLYLTDNDSNWTKWAMPSAVIPSGGYLIIWADEEGDEGALHCNFKLASGGERLILSYADSTVIDSFNYPPQNPDVALARYPNGTGPFIQRIPTFNANNDYTAVEKIQDGPNFRLFPNPASHLVYMEIEGETEACQIDLLDINGRFLQTLSIEANEHLTKMDLANYPAGMYFVRVQGKQGVTTQKLMIQN